MMDPPPDLRMAGMACLHPNHTPFTLMFIVRSHTDSSVVSALSSCSKGHQQRVCVCGGGAHRPCSRK